MASYRVLELSFINNSLQQPGAEVEYDGEPGKNLEPLDRQAKVAAKAVADTAPAVADLVTKVRQHAATRGVPPSEVNASDFDEVLAVLPNKPSDEVLAQAAKAVGVELASSVA
jgi:hypothetical protein